MSTWSRAFQVAKATAEEGRVAFADVLDDPTSAFAPRRAKRDRDGSDEDEEAGGEEGVNGCFRQPAGLSQFYKRLKEGGPAPKPADIQHQQEAQKKGAHQEGKPDENLEAAQVVGNLSRQICRAWLKSHYLGLGQPCDGVSCGGRSHSGPAVIAHMYKDYSFKGLSKENRAKIIKVMEAERSSLTS